MSTSLRAGGSVAVSLQSFTPRAREAGVLAPLAALCWAGGSPRFRASEEKGNVIGGATAANILCKKEFLKE